MKLLIFTDLDGTLLNHHDYGFADALPSLNQLKQDKHPIIFNSSKTRAEIMALRTKMEITDPFIVENGAALFIPEGYFPGNLLPLTPILFGPDRTRMLSIMHKLREKHHLEFVGFDDLSVAQVAEATGLKEEQADEAKQRIGSEPIKWLNDEQKIDLFKRELKEHNLKLIKGGRFWHVMGQTDKARAMQWLIKQFKDHFEEELKVIALGDSENDKAMLEQADISAVIKNNRDTHMQINKKDSVIYTENQGSKGWQEAMVQIFKQL